MNKCVLVTGASGFVGKAVCLYFLQHGFKVIGCGQQKAIDLKHQNFQYYAFHLSEWAHYAYLLEQIDCVVHLAALAHQLQGASANAFYEINTTCTQTLVTLCGQYNIPRFVYLSSIKVNGEKTTDRTFDEQAIPMPLDDYGHSKWLAEEHVQEICRQQNMAWVIIRPPLVYGPGVKANFANLIKLVDKKITLPFGCFKNKRSFIAIDNLCDFIFSCSTMAEARNQLFCISDDDDQSTKELIEVLQSVRVGTVKLFSFPPVILKGMCTLIGKKSLFLRLSESLQVDITKAKSLMNWQPKYTFKEAITRYFYTANIDQK